MSIATTDNYRVIVRPINLQSNESRRVLNQGSFADLNALLQLSAYQMDFMLPRLLPSPDKGLEVWLEIEQSDHTWSSVAKIDLEHHCIMEAWEEIRILNPATIVACRGAWGKEYTVALGCTRQIPGINWLGAPWESLLWVRVADSYPVPQMGGGSIFCGFVVSGPSNTMPQPTPVQWRYDNWDNLCWLLIAKRVVTISAP